MMGNVQHVGQFIVTNNWTYGGFFNRGKEEIHKQRNSSRKDYKKEEEV
jgi:hypothetical protein